MTTDNANTTPTDTTPPDGATSFLHVRVRPLDKAGWVRAANKRAQQQRERDGRGNLAGWVVDSLNEAASKPQRPRPLD